MRVKNYSTESVFTLLVHSIMLQAPISHIANPSFTALHGPLTHTPPHPSIKLSSHEPDINSGCSQFQLERFGVGTLTVCVFVCVYWMSEWMTLGGKRLADKTDDVFNGPKGKHKHTHTQAQSLFLSLYQYVKTSVVLCHSYCAGVYS